MIEQISIGLGIIILVVSAITGGILFLSPGSIRLQRPDCGWVGWTFNVLSLLFFFILIPVCGLLVASNTQVSFLICIFTDTIPFQVFFHFLGLTIFLLGSSLLLWSRMSLRRSFRLAGVKPSQNDYLTTHGPYKLIRHPMYLSALLVLLGLTLILTSIVMAVMFMVMVFLIIKLIPKEEQQLEQAYPVAYLEYCRRVPNALFPIHLP